LTEEIFLETRLTPELKDEGQVREIIRSIQEMRKEANLSVKDMVALEIGEGYEHADLIKKNKESISKTTGLSDILFISGNVPPHLHNAGVHRS
jgi:isoleucyl-tRNA synthetase